MNIICNEEYKYKVAQYWSECVEPLNYPLGELIHLAFINNFSTIKWARIQKNRCFVQLYTRLAVY